VLGLGFGVFSFIFRRRIGTVIMVVIGFFLGKKYLDGKMGEKRE
jgi:hypothetical protein